MDKVDMLNKKHNQVKYVEDLLKTPSKFDTHRTYLSDLRLLAIYMRDCLNMKPKQRAEEIEKFCKTNCENYNEVLWMNIIQKALGYAKRGDQKLKTIAYPVVYDFEFNYINSLELDENHKRVLFCALVFYKFEKNRCGYDKDNYYVPNFVLNPSDMKKYSGIKLGNGDDVAYIHGDLDRIGLLGYSPKGNGQVIANFIKNIDYSQISKNNIKIVSPSNSGLYYDYFVNSDKTGFCKRCGDIFKRRSNSQVYCKDCTKEFKPTSRPVVCIDCELKFSVPISDRRTCRCEKCQHEKQKEYQRHSMQKARNQAK